MQIKRLLLAILLLLPSIAFAHPGHGTTAPTSWSHYLTEPVHVVPLALAIVAVAIVALCVRHEARRRRL